MRGRRFERQRPNEPIKASTINAPLDAVEALQRLGVGPGLGLQWVGATPLISRAPEARELARIVSHAAGVYAWRGIYQSAPGVFSDLPANVSDQSGADPAREWNGNAAVPAGTRVELERDPSTGEWRFQMGTC